MNKKKMMHGMVGCRLRTMEGGGKTTTIKEEKIAYTNQEQMIALEEEAGKERAAQLVWYYKEKDGKAYRRLYDATNQEWLTDWILCK